MSARRSWIAAGIAAAAVLGFLASCSTLQQGVDMLGKAADAADKADQVIAVGQKIRSSFAEITEEEEYYIGRAVAALILSKYPAYDKPALNQYVNTMGNAIALFSDRPEVYAGYHFLVLDTDEVNALSAPGGLIFVTRGLIKRCADEEMLALVLAHEIGHVSAKHGLQAIKKSRMTETFTFLAGQAAAQWGPQELAKATALFQGVLDDIVQQLVVRGYDRSAEFEADALAVRFAVGAGYDPTGIQRFLKTMVGEGGGGLGWFKTHPSSEQRLERVGAEIGAISPAPRIEVVRTSRFRGFTAGLK